MTKTNRPPRQETPRKKSGGGMLLGLFLGLVVGVLIAFGVVLYLNKTPLPFVNKQESPKPANGSAAGSGGTPTQPVPPAQPAQPIALPGKPGDKVGEKPRFDFYGILEGKQPAGAGAAPTVAPAPDAPVKPIAKANEVFFLQVGAFQKAADADNLKARLAMLGVEAGVQEADVPEKGKMHRVRVGPMSSPEEMNKVRTLLSQSGVQATIVKQKPE